MKIFKISFSIFAIAVFSLFGVIGYYNITLSDQYYCNLEQEIFIDNKMINVDENIARSVGKSANNLDSKTSNVKLFGVFPVKNIVVNTISSDEVIILGTSFGVKLYFDGLLVIGTTDIETNNGVVNPSTNAGIEIGDIIMAIDGVYIESTQQFSKIIETSNGNTISLLVLRNNKEFTIDVEPIFSTIDNCFKIGLWVRESTAGIGTLTYFNVDSNIAAGLGHGITDQNTGVILPIKEGTIHNSKILGIKKSTQTETGEIQGSLSNVIYGDIMQNCETGIYSSFDINAYPYSLNKKYVVGLKQEIVAAEAKIITSLDGEEPKEYSCVIEKIYRNDNSNIKNMVIKITDAQLLDKCGGIIQGMSGSPIIQNGKFIGAVTHVFVNEPTRGYAIFAENMIYSEKNQLIVEKMDNAS